MDDVNLPAPVQIDEPTILGKWNWGACFIGMFWSGSMGLRNWCAIIVALNIVGIPSRFMPDIILIFKICIGIYLGSKGNALAWNSPRRRWESAQQFEDTQQVWRKWGIGLMCVDIVGIALLYVFIIFFVNPLS